MKTFLNFAAFCSLLFWGVNTQAQREFYSTSVYSTGPGTSSQEGKLVKLDATGMLPTVLHQFNAPEGKLPYGSVVQAANGKLYGLTTKGGQADNGVLYEYDLAIDSFVVKQHLGVTFSINNGGGFGLFEASNGKLYYVSGAKYLMEYDIAANALTQRHYFNSPQAPSGTFTEINGKLYGVINFGGPVGYRGYIYEYNTANQTVTYKLNFHTSQGMGPTERPVYFAGNGLLYGTVRYKPNTSGLGDSQGGIYSFNPTNNAYAYKLDIPDSIGYAEYLVVAPNGKIYGLSETGGTDAAGGHHGSIFEYTPANNSIRLVHSFGMQADGSFTGAGYTLGGMILASDGMMYGTTASHAFRFNYLTDEVTRLVDLGTQNNLMGIWFNYNGFFEEVCRKPSYTYFDTLAFTLCPGDTFAYTVHSNNAETFLWKKNGTPLALQADSVLYFNNITAADSGNYTCYMTNVCGNTETIGYIRLTVSSQVTAPVISASGSTQVCEGETVTLTGNTGGTWNAGGNGTSLTVDTSGTYYVISGSGSCGTDTSNAITVTVNPMPVLDGQPADIGVPAGNQASFSVVAQGSGHTYQWQENDGSGLGFMNLDDGIPYSGTHTSMLLITPALPGMDERKYRCIVTLGDCTDTSETAQLFVEFHISVAEWADASQLKVYPNPAGEVLYFTLKEGNTVQSLMVRNVLGQEVMKQTGNTTSLSVASLVKGAYTIELTTHEGVYATRFIKE